MLLNIIILKYTFNLSDLDQTYCQKRKGTPTEQQCEEMIPQLVANIENIR